MVDPSVTNYLDEKVNLILDTFTETNRTLREELRDEFMKINTNIDNKIKPIVQRLNQVEGTTDDNTRMVEIHEKERRKRNVILFGLDQERDENFKSLEEKVLQIIQDKMNITIHSMEVDSIKRFGKPTNTNKRPIMITLTTWKRKMEIITNGRKLKGTGLVVKEDFPPQVQEEKKKLYTEMKTLRNQGKRVYIKHNKLVVSEHDKVNNKVMMEVETVQETNDNERQKRKAEEPIEQLRKSKGTPVSKKHATHQRTGSGTISS